MTANVIDLRLRKLEKASKMTAYSRLSDDQLDALIEDGLPSICAPYGSLEATVVGLAASPDPEDHELARHLEWYIGEHGDRAELKPAIL